jgi:hypothetical protein
LGKLRFSLWQPSHQSWHRRSPPISNSPAGSGFFYGLFLRGYSAEKLRQDIEVPPAVLAKWHREAEREPQLRDIFTRMVEYRRHVLAIFDALVGSDGIIRHVQ